MKIPDDPLSPEILNKLVTDPIREIYNELLREHGAPHESAWADLWRSTHACVPQELRLHVRVRGDSTRIADMATSGGFRCGEPFSLGSSFDPANALRDGWGTFLTSRLGDLLSLPEVVEVDAEDLREGEPILNYSAPDIGTSALRAQFSWMTGVGVLIVTIDEGVDWRHEAFLTTDGTSTRIEWIWDRGLTKQGEETEGPGTVGVLYKKCQINCALKSEQIPCSQDCLKVDVRSRDHEGHGTHVAGIAAGNGAPRSRVCCVPHAGHTYVGVAPEAKIATVKGIGIADILNALDANAELISGPVVVNISLALRGGPRDGTDLAEKAINDFLSEPKRDADGNIVLDANGKPVIIPTPGRVVVVGSGDSADRNYHAVIDVAAGQQIDLPIRAAPGTTKRHPTVNLYGPGNQSLEYQIVGPSGGATRFAQFDPNDPLGTPVVDDVTVITKTRILDTQETNLELIFLGPGAHLSETGFWLLRMKNTGSASISVHAFVDALQSEDDFRFTTDNDQPPPPPGIRASVTTTLTTPSTALRAITVGAYDQRESFCDFSPSGDVPSYSGRGPARGNPQVNVKPTITAPGHNVTAPRADAANLVGNLCHGCPDWLFSEYQDLTGTSMSAPHVAGVVAVMLQVNPTLTHDKAEQFLRQSARPGLSGDANTWGAGKVDMEHAVALALQDWLDQHGTMSASEVSPEMHVAAARLAELKSARAVPPPAAPTAAPVALINALRAAPDGELVASAISRSFSEARRLINSHARVATMWHRADGPAVLRKLALSAREPRTPALLAGETQRAYFRRFLDQLRRYGSPRLQRAIDAHGDRVARALETPFRNARTFTAIALDTGTVA